MRLGSPRRAALALAAASLCTTVPCGAAAAVKLTRLATVSGSVGPVFGMVRTGDGELHLVYPTVISPESGLTGLTISPSGATGAPVSVLTTDWQTNLPGLVELPGGTLETFFGGASPASFNPPSLATMWGLTSADGGATWSTPEDVRSGPNENLAYGSALTAQVSGTTPVLTVPQAGNLVIQSGLGAGVPTYVASTSTDGSVGTVDSALDAGTGAVVAAWQSLAGSGGDYIEQVAPTPGTPELVPGKVLPEQLVVGRDSGPGVFAPYTTDGTHVRLLRYGGGTVAVGRASGVTAAALGVATGIDGRIWVMWGADGGRVAVTRSNKAVTRFEPIQVIETHALTLFRLAGDGRLGPFDLLVDQIADTTPLLPAGLYHARVLPELSASVAVTVIKNKKTHVITSYKLKVTVTDAGDAVPGATVSVAGHTKKTGATGAAKLALPGSSPSKLKLTATAPSYRVLTRKVRL